MSIAFASVDELVSIAGQCLFLRTDARNDRVSGEIDPIP
jgi:hypothetical protein